MPPDFGVWCYLSLIITTSNWKCQHTGERRRQQRCIKLISQGNTWERFEANMLKSLGEMTDNGIWTQPALNDKKNKNQNSWDEGFCWIATNCCKSNSEFKWNKDVYTVPIKYIYVGSFTIPISEFYESVK